MFKFKQQVTGKKGKDGSKEVEIMVQLNYLNNFWTTLEMPLINNEIVFMFNLLKNVFF